MLLDICIRLNIVVLSEKQNEVYQMQALTIALNPTEFSKTSEGRRILSLQIDIILEEVIT